MALVAISALVAALNGGSPRFATPAQSGSSHPALIGRASVIDGDTIEIRGERIRFNGIDAPESRQLCQDANGHNYRCGTAAANALATFLARSSPTRCEYVDRDRYGRVVADCYRADGSSVAAWLVRNGHALDWPRYSRGRYAADQRTAKTDRTGIWQGTFEKPWEWRARN
ncbi:thermonuclease family protein [Stappia sp. F7233]|uniref:Thermonuclease family protein n=1 Tax=Stappia albiluteola TaxID=2758565 RepID=A0A839AA38_9HYPH|nr:thermonuclease family protein [Stappia albiluteola]